MEPKIITADLNLKKAIGAHCKAVSKYKAKLSRRMSKGSKYKQSSNIKTNIKSRYQNIKSHKGVLTPLSQENNIDDLNDIKLNKFETCLHNMENLLISKLRSNKTFEISDELKQNLLKNEVIASKLKPKVVQLKHDHRLERVSKASYKLNKFK